MCLLVISSFSRFWSLHLQLSDLEAFSEIEVTKALAKRRRKLTQVEDLGQLATSFGQGLRALALTCDDLRSLWSRSNLHANQVFHRLATQPKLTQVE